MTKITWEDVDYSKVYERNYNNFEYYIQFENQDILGFYDSENNFLGLVSIGGLEDLEALENGACPIADDWEDGLGHKVRADGWGVNEYTPRDELYERLVLTPNEDNTVWTGKIYGLYDWKYVAETPTIFDLVDIEDLLDKAQEEAAKYPW